MLLQKPDFIYLIKMLHAKFNFWANNTIHNVMSGSSCLTGLHEDHTPHFPSRTSPPMRHVSPIVPPGGRLYSGQLQTLAWDFMRYHTNPAWPVALTFVFDVNAEVLCVNALTQISMQIMHSSVGCVQSTSLSEQSLQVFTFGMSFTMALLSCLSNTFLLKTLNASWLISKMIHVCWTQTSECIKPFFELILPFKQFDFQRQWLEFPRPSLHCRAARPNSRGWILVRWGRVYVSVWWHHSGISNWQRWTLKECLHRLFIYHL